MTPTDEVDAVLDRIAAEIAGGRSLFSAQEVVDLLLDLRIAHQRRIDALIAAARRA
jgi:hypothetical protein